MDLVRLAQSDLLLRGVEPDALADGTSSSEV
ncbi:MAG: hypothetical protein ACI81P_003154 [Neolewinella sp.]|jgi:hypothetical protein